jgi:hypothetical protein
MAMKNTNIRVDPEGGREGHGGNGGNTGAIRKGTFMPVGTFAEMNDTAISPNKKSGSSSGGEDTR